MRHDLNIKLKEISDKVTEGLNQEKKAWENLHEVESEVSDMMVMIDRVVEETVSKTIKHGISCCVSLLKLIDKYTHCCHKAIQSFL